MDPRLKIIAVLLSAPVVIFIIHAVLTRARRGESNQVTAFSAAVWGYVPVAALLLFCARDAFAKGDAIALWVVYCMAVYTSMAYIYFHFFNMSESARRIRILYEIEKAGMLSAARIRELYKSYNIIHVRLERLIALEALRREDGLYIVHKRPLYWSARFIRAWRRLLNMGRRYVDRET